MHNLYSIIDWLYTRHDAMWDLVHYTETEWFDHPCYLIYMYMCVCVYICMYVCIIFIINSVCSCVCLLCPLRFCGSLWSLNDSTGRFPFLKVRGSKPAATLTLITEDRVPSSVKLLCVLVLLGPTIKNKHSALARQNKHMLGYTMGECVWDVTEYRKKKNHILSVMILFVPKTPPHRDPELTILSTWSCTLLLGSCSGNLTIMENMQKPLVSINLYDN